MNLSDLPYKFQHVWATGSGAGPIIDPIPDSGASGGHTSQQTGFAAINALPIGSGGVPPWISDTNGVLKYITSWTQWLQAGSPIQHDPTFSAAIGGYPAGALLLSDAHAGQYWVSNIDNNTSDPDTGGANWSPFPFSLNGEISSADLQASIVLTDAPSAPTAAPGTSTNQLATTQFVTSAVQVNMADFGVGVSSFTIPPGIFAIKATVTGSGGGGGNCNSTTLSALNDFSGSGGGAGATTIEVISVTPGQVLSITVAAGGGAQVDGGASFITGYISATGGMAGAFQATGVSAGGAPGGAGSVGSLIIFGGYGSDGQEGDVAFAGNGGSSYWGGGGRAGNNGGLSALAFGAGGGGAYNGISATGGQGGNCTATLEW